MAPSYILYRRPLFSTTVCYPVQPAASASSVGTVVAMILKSIFILTKAAKNWNCLNEKYRRILLNDKTCKLALSAKNEWCSFVE